MQWGPDELRTAQEEDTELNQLQSDLEGPYTVANQLRDVVYRIKTGEHFVVVHHDRLAPVVTPVPEICGEIPSSRRPVLEARNSAEPDCVESSGWAKRKWGRPRRLEDFVT
ncbi:hypothetical protein MHYP_G00244980 [Metynnis hypsauchen]